MKQNIENKRGCGRSLQRLVSRHWVKAPDGELLLHLPRGHMLSVRGIQTVHGDEQYEALKVFRDEVVHYAGLHGSQIEAQHAAEMTANRGFSNADGYQPQQPESRSDG